MNAREERLEIRFGALCPALKEQLNKYKTDPKEIAQLQKDHDAIVRLSIKGIMSQMEKRNAQNRLFKRIVAHLKKEAKV